MTAWAALVLGAALVACGPSGGATPGPTVPVESVKVAAAAADFGETKASADARTLTEGVMRTGDHSGLPFAIVDKVAAHVYVFTAGGRMLGDSPVLLGLARGDDSVPGIGTRAMASIRPHERTTPAGRFVTEPGRNLGGEAVIWVDYDAAVSMHAVRPNVKSERRLERLEASDPAEHRISWGCINLPTAFFKRIAEPAFRNGGMVYVLPETRALHIQFPLLATRKGLGS